MKKIAFLHATTKLKNAIHLESLVLEKVPKGLFSKVRNTEGDQQETLLEGIIRDLLCSKQLDEVVVLTSPESCDDSIETLCRSFGDEVSVKCHRIGKDKSYAVTSANRFSRDAYWPYIFAPVYGAWHVDGLLEIGQEFKAGCACLLQADSAILLDIGQLDRWLTQYSSMGFSGKVPDFIQTEFAIVNLDFMKELSKKHRNRSESFFEKKNNKIFFGIEKFFIYHGEETGRGDFNLSFGASAPPMSFLYRKKDLRESVLLGSGPFEAIQNSLEGQTFLGVFRGPSFLEVELQSAEGNLFSLQRLKALVDEACDTLFAINLIVANIPSKSLKDYFQYAKERVPMVMLELNSEALGPSFLPLFEEILGSLNLVQFNTSHETDIPMLMNLIETTHKKPQDQRPLLVLKLSPQDMEKYDSFKVLVDRVLIKNAGTNEEGKEEVDFSPFERQACRKLSTSFFSHADGGFSTCRYLSPFQSEVGDLLSCFHAPKMKDLRSNHQRREFDFSPECSKCKEWYLPDVPDLFSVSLCLNPKKISPVFSKILKDPKACEEAFGQLIQITDYLLKKSSEPFSFGNSLSGRVAWNYLRMLLHFFNRHFFLLGDQLMQFGEEAKALEAWERVLQSDPTHKEVHSRLDDLLTKKV